MGDDIRISSDEVMDIVRKTRQFADSLGENLDAPKKQVPLALEAILSQPEISSAQSVVDVHDGANVVVSKTLTGVKKDLNDFADSLQRAVEDHDRTDTMIELLLKGMLGPLGAGGDTDIKIDVSDDSITVIGDADGPSAADDARDDAINNQGNA